MPRRVGLSIKRATPYLRPILISISCFVCAGPLCQAQQAKKPFTVADDIGLAYFGDPYTSRAEALQFSPDGKYFAAYTERGRLELNRVEDSLRFYRCEDIESFLKHPDESQAPSPVWVVNRSSAEGLIIKAWRWLADSGGVAFLEGTPYGSQQLMLADLTKKRIKPLVTQKVRSLDAFDVRDKSHYVYTVANLDPVQKIQAERKAAAIVGTGRPLAELVFPDSWIKWLSRRSYLMAVVGGKRFEVKRNGASFIADGGVALSPDGHSLVTVSSVAKVPVSWETLYPPSYASSRTRIRVGSSANQYVRIDLQSGSEQSLTGAPVSGDAGMWVGDDTPSWSTDGRAILLPGTFLKSDQDAPSRPCVAVVDLTSNTSTCVEILKGHTDEKDGVEEGYHFIWAARFVHGDKRRVKVTFLSHEDESIQTTEYQEDPEGRWRAVEHVGLKVTVKQSFNEPPRLVASDGHVSRIIWDPNPQLKDIELGEVALYKWKDKEGRERKGELYKPKNYKPGQRYPLVIQTHGFEESGFHPSGLFPTAFAATELAAAGIAVLQVGVVGACPLVTPDEAPCNASGYEIVANQLVSDGFVDPERIGIIGFSRTCFYVMEMLTTGSLHVKAASITDGLMFTYSEYVLNTDRVSGEADAVIGAPPFGEGLQQWLKRSPGFNLDKITAPLLVVGEGPFSLLYMWVPYAGLHYLKKPVDVIMLNTDEHVLRNPEARMASQGGSVDWFRFWLKGEEDPDPAKAEQYARWRELQKVRDENANNVAASHAN